MYMKAITSILKNNVWSHLKESLRWNFDKMVHASFRKVVAFDLLFLVLGMAIGAGLITAFLTGDIYRVISRW